MNRDNFHVEDPRVVSLSESTFVVSLSRFPFVVSLSESPFVVSLSNHAFCDISQKRSQARQHSPKLVIPA